MRLLIGLLISEVLSKLSKPKLVFIPVIVVAPVPPFTIATTPVTFVALPDKLPTNEPLASLFTIVALVFKSVAALAKTSAV